MSRKPTRQSLCHALLVALGMVSSAPLLAQSTTGVLFGQAPGQDVTVRIESATGATRDLPVDAQGRYRSPGLAVGDYTVELVQGGAVVQRQHVLVKVGAASEVSFEAPAASSTSATDLKAVKVSAAAAPPIDVAAVDSRTVIVADQLRKLPLGRSAEDIARLAPGTVENSGGFTSTTGRSLVSFGGSSPTENAYYVNGFNTTDPLNAAGGLSLPYGAISQQETYTGGYSAQYGRSDGGVINVIGKRGTNQWHYGFQMVWEPDWARSKGESSYYANGLPNSPVAGDPYLYSYKKDDGKDDWSTAFYAGGPLIKDTLFFFASVELERSSGTSLSNVGSNESNPYLDYNDQMPKGYAKIDWNITSNQMLELTGVSDRYKTWGSYYTYDYSDKTRGDYVNSANKTETGGNLWVAKYTNYITDALAFSGTYGKMRTRNYSVPGNYDATLPYIYDAGNQNPALNGGTPITNSQVVDSISDPGQGNQTSNLRLDLTWVLGNHTLSAGIDNLKSIAASQGARSSGPGYNWSYQYTSSPTSPINADAGIGAVADYANGAGGYYVQQNVYSQSATISSSQKAQYIEDRWQVTPDLLLSLGLRNDQFINYDAGGQPYIRQEKPQWAPRLGAAWDVYGDSSTKVYGNIGRYYLGLPLNPALVAASNAINTAQYFTYSGIAADGTPTGLTQISEPYSSLNQYGQDPDPKTASAAQIEPEYQDEFILGFDKTLGSKWVYGAKATFRNLRNAIDDFCSMSQVVEKAQSLGYDVENYNSCYLFNPGRANTFLLKDTSGNYVSVPMTNDELGFPQLKRRYYSIETVLEHPLDNNWYGKLSYVWSRSYGNTEGQVRSDASQSGTSTSYDWDNTAIMQYTNGPQNNDHTHQIKLYGYYQFTPEWLASANISAISGTPKHCLSYYGTDQTDPLGYGSVYHFCNGEPSPPGTQGRMPWVTQLDLGVSYSPAFAAHRLTFGVDVFNVLNAQTPLQRYAFSENAPFSPNPLFNTVTIRQQPRYARLSVSYDF
jgi:outer membrane receptor for ferrienterochelin and colicin